MQHDAITAKKLTIQKDSRTILDALDFHVGRGKITGLIGPSGSGKTTLMRSIVGVQKVSSGKLQVLGQMSGSKQLRSKIGYVTQSPAVYEDLTVQQNLEYFAKLARANAHDVTKLIKTVRLDKHAVQLVSTLSGGQRARVSLAVALLGEPDLLVLDEPTVGLDPLLRSELWDLFRAMADDGKTLLVSSHVMDEAERCDDLLLLYDGKLLWSDTTTKLLAATGQKTVEAAFVRMITQEKKS